MSFYDYLVFVMPSSHRRRGQDSIQQFSVVLNILETEQFYPVLSAMWTRL